MFGSDVVPAYCTMGVCTYFEVAASFVLSLLYCVVESVGAVTFVSMFFDGDLSATEGVGGASALTIW